MTELNTIRCRAAVGQQLPIGELWEPGKPVEFIYAPAGVHELTAGFRDGAIRITVVVDSETPALLQESLDHLQATTSQECFADEDHLEQRATLRFGPETQFTWGQINGNEGVIISGGKPTSYGSECANGKVFRSWSPSFETDADYSQLTRTQGGLYLFPDFVRGSVTNPARVVGIGGLCIGSLTNAPAFKVMPAVKARAAAGGPMTTESIFAELQAKRAAATAILDLHAASNAVLAEIVSFGPRRFSVHELRDIDEQIARCVL